MFDTVLDTLLDPPFAFAQNPARRSNAKTVGLVLAVLSALSLLVGLMSMPGILRSSNLAFVLALNLYVGLFASGLALFGGYKMYRSDPEGKRWVIYGLLLYAVVGIVSILAGSAGQILTLIAVGVAYYFVVTSRYATSATTEKPSQNP
jgi:hypothetical protein